MPRRAKGPRLWADETLGYWYVRDGAAKRGTGCRLDDRRGAEKALEAYIAQKHDPGAGEGDPAAVLVDDVLTYYGRHVAPGHRSSATTGYAIDRLLAYWSGRPIRAIKRSSCGEYVAYRMAQARPQAKSAAAKARTVTQETARRELTVLRAAINAYHAEHGLDALPVVTLPEASPPRERWLTRQEVARLIRAARNNLDRDAARALCRFVLLAIYTGTRAGALRTLGWVPNTRGGRVDLGAGVLYRRQDGDGETRKRKRPAKLPPALLSRLRRWRAQDGAIPWVIHYRGRPIDSQRRAWDVARKAAGLGDEVTPHILKHTAVTWAMRTGADPVGLSHYFSTSLKTLMDVYGHHHPDFQSETAARIGRGGRR